MQDFKRQVNWDDNDDFELLFQQEHHENRQLKMSILELNQTIIDLEMQIIKMTKKIHLMTVYGSFSEDDIQQIDEGL